MFTIFYSSNVAIHTVTSYVIMWSVFFLVSFFLPIILLHINLVAVLILCMLQDVLLGVSSDYNIIIKIHQSDWTITVLSYAKNMTVGMSSNDNVDSKV